MSGVRNKVVSPTECPPPLSPPLLPYTQHSKQFPSSNTNESHLLKATRLPSIPQRRNPSVFGLDAPNPARSAGTGSTSP